MNTHAAPGSRAPIAPLLAVLDDAAGAIDRDLPLARERIAAARAMVLARARQTPATSASGGLAPWQIRRMVAHIDAHIEGTITNDALAAIARLSTSQLCRAFRQSLGTTPHAFVMARRIESAALMMIRDDEPLASIALACGFADQAHLSRLFRRAKGSSPATWRREHAASRLIAA